MKFKTKTASRLHEQLIEIVDEGLEHKLAFDMFLDWMLDLASGPEQGMAERRRHYGLKAQCTESVQKRFEFSRNMCFVSMQDEKADVLGDYFETCGFGDKTRGQVFTPAHLCDLVVEQVLGTSNEPAQQRICDPCCGSGRFLLAAGKRQPDALFVGIEIDRMLARITAINLAVNALTGLVICADLFDITPGPLANCTFDIAYEVGMPERGFIKTIEPRLR